MENKLDKKTLISVIIASVTLLTLVVGATYSYFTITSKNNFGTKSLTAEIEDMANNVTLTQENNTISLDLSRVQMSETNKNTWYYSSGSGTPTKIAKIVPDGEGSYVCNYTMSITKSATNDMYTAFQGLSGDSEIYLSVDNKKYYFPSVEDENRNTFFPITHTGTIIGITQDNPQYITANMAIFNGEWEQNELKGTDITLTFSISNLNCGLEPEYTEIAFTRDYLDEIGYSYTEDIGNYYIDKEELFIPATFTDQNGVTYKVTSIADGAFDWFMNLESVILPETVTSIGECAFTSAWSLKSIYIPDGLTSIGVMAFEAAALTNIFIPKSVEHIGMSPFNENYLTDIYYEGTEAEWNTLFSKYIDEINAMTDCYSDSEQSCVYQYLGINETTRIHFNSDRP